MKQMQKMDMDIGIYLPGVKIKTSETDWSPIEQLQLEKFEGETWKLFDVSYDRVANIIYMFPEIMDDMAIKEAAIEPVVSSTAVR